MSILSGLECSITEGFLVDNLFTKNKYCEKSVWWGANIFLPKSDNPFLIRPYYQVRYYTSGGLEGYLILRGEMGFGNHKARQISRKKVEDCIDFLTAIERFKEIICKDWKFGKEDLVVTKIDIN